MRKVVEVISDVQRVTSACYKLLLQSNITMLLSQNTIQEAGYRAVILCSNLRRYDRLFMLYRLLKKVSKLSHTRLSLDVGCRAVKTCQGSLLVTICKILYKISWKFLGVGFLSDTWHATFNLLSGGMIQGLLSFPAPFLASYPAYEWDIRFEMSTQYIWMLGCNRCSELK